MPRIPAAAIRPLDPTRAPATCRVSNPRRSIPTPKIAPPTMFAAEKRGLDVEEFDQSEIIEEVQLPTMPAKMPPKHDFEDRQVGEPVEATILS